MKRVCDLARLTVGGRWAPGRTRSAISGRSDIPRGRRAGLRAEPIVSLFAIVWRRRRRGGVLTRIAYLAIDQRPGKQNPRRKPLR